MEAPASGAEFSGFRRKLAAIESGNQGDADNVAEQDRTEEAVEIIAPGRLMLVNASPESSHE